MSYRGKPFTRGVSQSPVSAIARPAAANKGGVSSISPVAPRRHRVINTPRSKGGLGLFNIKKFTMSLKAAFILRYVRGTDDHWCDKVDLSLGTTKENRKEILAWGDLRFENIIKERLICISSIFSAWKELTKHFPTAPDSRDNSWVSQALFHNSNITTKIPTNNARGFKMCPLEPIYFGFPRNCCIKVIDLYRGGLLKPREEIINLIAEKYNITFEMEEGSYLRLTRAMKFVVGLREKMEGTEITFPMTIPATTPSPPKYSSSTMTTLTNKIVKGSQKFRLILTRDTDFLTTAKVESWQASLDNVHINKDCVRQAFKMAQCKLFDADIRDYILKFLCRKTLFNAQLDRVYPTVKPAWYTDIYCHSCKMQDVLIPETCLHAMVDCPAVRAARTTTYQNLNIAVRPTANSSEDSILWTKSGKVLGPSRTKSTLSLINAILWLTSCEIQKRNSKW